MFIMRKTLLLSITLVLVLGCRPDQEAEKKIDPYLKMWMQELTEEQRYAEVVTILFKINDELTENHYAWMRKNGILLKAQMESLCAAQTNAIGIYLLARQRFVNEITPSKAFIQEIQTKLLQDAP